MVLWSGTLGLVFIDLGFDEEKEGGREGWCLERLAPRLEPVPSEGLGAGVETVETVSTCCAPCLFRAVTWRPRPRPASELTLRGP